jgi:DNA-binding transcriptional ArsR family regulator
MSFSDDERITLDRGTFKALASETRVDILKRLDGTQKTVSELARELNMNKATMYQHLEQLRDVGLVKRLDGDERMTTVKPEDPLEAPEAGPMRKWVYYRLTWKGKNVVNPGKVRFAVMLAVIGIVSIAIIAIFAANFMMNGPGPETGHPAADQIPPEITMWTTPEASTQTTTYTFSVTIRDSYLGDTISGLKEENVTLYYGIGATNSGGPNLVAYTPLQVTHSGDRFSASPSGVDWPHLGARYLYLKVEAWDRVGNKNSTVRVIYIAGFKEPDLGFGNGNAAVEGGGGGSGAVGITANIKNFGDASSGPFSVGVYSINPDPDGDGIIEVTNLASYTLYIFTVNQLDPGKETNLTQTLTKTDLKKTSAGPGGGGGRVYFVIDPENELKEESKVNNVVSVSPPSGFWSVFGINPPKTTNGAGRAPGFELYALLGAIAVVVVIRARRSKKEE